MMKFAVLLLFFILSNLVFGQSFRQKNQELKVEYEFQKEIATSLLHHQLVLNESLQKLKMENHKFIQDLLNLCIETEKKKVEFHALINETNDTLIDWSMFYRRKDISFNQLKVYQDSVFESLAEQIILMPLEMDFSDVDKLRSKDLNLFLSKEIAFFMDVIPTFKMIITQLENQLAMQEFTRLKLDSWKGIIQKTSDYCLGKSGSAPFIVSETKLDMCGTVLAEEILSDTLFKKEIVKDEFYKMPEFSGGKEALKTYLKVEVIKAGIKSEDPDFKKMYVKFIVTDNGEILNPTITRGPDCFQCNKAVLKIIQEMPRWIPATKGGHPVSTLYRLPIKIN